jgi:capsular polysaccharide biosynthesis protein
MELTEAFERVFVRHWVLILVCVLLTTAGATAYELQQPPLYKASARFVLDASDPTSETAALALADTAKALATAPTTVRVALDGLQVQRDAAEVAKHVSVVPLGSSGVLVLSVTDTASGVAHTLANSLAQSVIRTRNEIAFSGVDAAIKTYDQEISDLATPIKNLNSTIDGLSPNDPKLIGLEQRRNDLTAQRAAIQTAESSLKATLASAPKAASVDPAGLAVQVNGFALPAAIALAVALGLIIGLTLAGLKETFSPTIGGRAAFSREAGAPYLGSLPAPPWSNDASNVSLAASRVRLAAAAAAVDRVELIGVDPSLDLRPLAQEMYAALGERAQSGPQISVIDSPEEATPTSRTKNTRHRTALVLVTPAVVKRSAFQAIEDYRSLAGMDLLGVVDYRRYRWHSDRKREKAFPAIEGVTEGNPPEHDVHQDQVSAQEKVVNS